MATTIQFAQAMLNPTLTTYYTTTAGQAMVQEMIFCNTGTSPASVTMNFVANGASATTANTILAGYLISPGSTVFLSETTGLPSLTSIMISASVDAVVGITISGVDPQ